MKTDNIYRLAYKFDIYAINPFSHKLYYIDAITGEVLDINNLIFDANSTGTAATRYSGTQSITTDSYTSGFRLRETRNSVRVETYNMTGLTAHEYSVDFSDKDNNWTAAEYDNSNKDNAALDAHWGLERVYEYWYTVRNRNSLDGKGLPLLNYVHAPLESMGYSNNDNAFWDGQRMTYGDGTTMNPFVSLDVVAHETGHGFTQFAFGLGSSGEPGALNEGFSDIWGAVIEHWAAPNDPNKKTWLHGEQIVKDGTYIRSLSNPKGNGYPDTYKGFYWDSNGEVHKNSTVLSHWFYLLSQGGSGRNDLGNSYYAYGIGINAAATIVYQAENVNLKNHPNAQYTDAMTQTIRAATDLYGANSFKVEQVKNAWYAVGLGTQPIQALVSGPANVCSSNSTFSVSNIPSGYTISWNKSNNLTLQSIPSSSTAVFSANGSGQGWVQVTFISSLDTIVSTQYPVWLGVPSKPIGIGGFYNGEVLGNYSIYDFALNYLTTQGVNQFNWTVSGGTILSGQGTNTIEIRTIKLAKGAPNYILNVTVKDGNSCGWSNNLLVSGYVSSGSIGPAVIISFSPNPATNDVKVSITNNPDTKSFSDSISTVFSSTALDNQKAITSYIVNVYNSFGILFYSAKKMGDTFSIPVGSLKDGMYIVEVNNGKQSYSQQLIIKH